MRRAAALVIVIVAGLLAGCSGSPGTRPIGPPRRLTSVEYDIVIDQRPLAAVKVWSLGRPRSDDDGDPLAERGIEVNLRVRNRTDEALTLDAPGARLEVHTEHDPLLIVAGPARVRGTPEVPPGGDAWVALTFELPARAHPSEVTAYELLWSLATPAGRVSRTTTFVGEREDDGYSYGASTYPFYGLGGSFPFGYGANLGPGRGYYGYWW